MNAATAGEEFYMLFLTEWKGLDADTRSALARVVNDRAPWDRLPPGLRATFEGWALLFLPEGE